MLRCASDRVATSRRAVFWLLLWGWPSLAWPGVTGAQRQALPPPFAGSVQFTRDIQPVLGQACVKCHGRGKAKGGFSLETREALLKGGDSGPAVVVGRSGASYLIELVAGVDPDNVMPLKGSRLTSQQVGLLRAWIDQGLPWDAGVSFAKPAPRNLVPRKPELPDMASAKSDHPVDRLLAPYFAEHAISPGQPVGDRQYARRAYLDVIGLLPTPEELERFLADADRDKREHLVERLLADRQRYAEHWLTFWNDLLRNDYRGTGYIDDGRKQISYWLFSALVQNMPYDRFVAQLVNPTEASEGFVNGIVWRGVVNASQTPPMQAAQNIAQVFMGVNLKCASCHDSFIDDWTLADSYGLASVYADGPLEMFRCDRPTGQTAPVRFLYPQLGDIPAEASKAERRQRLAQIMAGRENGRLTRTIVNRLWQRFMGRGLVEPVDQMEEPAWHPDLLDWLAEDLADHGYDLKHTMKRILTSRAYQLPAVNLPEQAPGDYVFSGPVIRRMTAEQFRDALGRLTGQWFELPEAILPFGLADPGPEAPALFAVAPKWIWCEAAAAESAQPETVYWRKAFRLEAQPDEAIIVATCDSQFTLFINGERVLSGNDYKTPRFALIAGHLRAGENLVAVEAVNGRSGTRDANRQDQEDGANPAGLLVYLRVRAGDRVSDLASDASWTWSRAKSDAWEKPGQVAGEWRAGAALGNAAAEPWNIGERFAATLSVVQVHGKVRSSLVASDPLMTALGRPPREQLLTTRDPTATTLQALELTNGDTLSRILQQGAERLLSSAGPSGGTLIDSVFLKALGRPPTPPEEEASRALLKDPIEQAGVEDLLWAVAMLPEFQLIY